MDEKRKAQQLIAARRKVLLGLGTGSALAVWHKPVINSVVIPAHADGSMLSPAPPPPVDPPPPPPPVDPATICPEIVIGNVVSGGGSGAALVCTVNFDVFSADAVIPLTIVSITTSTLGADVTVQIQGLGAATNVAGPRVVWTGPAVGAPFQCNPAEPVEDVTFTVTATCDAVAGVDTTSDNFTMDFSLINDVLTAI